MREPAVGIDLGTTNSAVATVEDGKPRVIPARAGGLLTPSIVGFSPEGQRLVGNGARQLADSHPEYVVHATKRFLGQRFTPELAAQAKSLAPYLLVGGPNGDVRVKVAGRTLPLTQVAAMILGELKLDAEAHFGRPIHKAVITVPANFNEAQRQATKEAAHIAGLEAMRLTNEPTAAALAYGLDSNFQGRALVFDLGGGTFDVSILEMKDGVFEVRATGGDPHLGGEDFDQRIVQWLLAQVDERYRETVAHDRLSLHRLKVAAEKAKRELTEHDEVLITVAELGDNASGKRLSNVETALTRAFFETLSEPLSRRCLAVCERVMAEAQLVPHAVDAVLLVGGMTRVPLVRRLVADFFGRAPATDVHPDEAVALGAAIHASEIGRQQGTALLLDVASHSLGVGILGGKVKRLIAKNATVPVIARQLFVPSSHGQTEVRIPVYQGESETVDGSAKLGELVLKDLQNSSRDATPLEVVFELSSEATLTVRVTDLTTGLAEAVRLEARTNLPVNEVDRLSQEQEAYAVTQSEADAGRANETFRRLLERGDRLIQALQKSAEENPSEEADAAVQTVARLLEAGRNALETQDRAQCVVVARQLATLVVKR